MNKVVSLVNEWDKFEQQHTNGDIADFCRYFLAQNARRDDMVGGKLPPSDGSLLMKIMGKLIHIYRIYFEAAMAELNVPLPETFYFLNELRFLEEVKKTDLINAMLMEYTTGMDAINKLIKEGYIKSRQHDTDKRATLISLTEKGRNKLQECYKQMSMVTEMMFKSMHPEAIKLCISLLGEAEVYQSKIVHDLKGKPFKEMYEQMISRP